MRQALGILAVIIVTISCNEHSETDSEFSADVQDIDQPQPIEPTDTTKKELSDTVSPEPEIVSKKVKPDIVELSGTTKVKTTQYELEFIDTTFRHQLDSLIKFEKKCLSASDNELHWTFIRMTDNMYELTAHTDFGSTYHGYALIDNSFVFIGPEKPLLYQKTERKKDFVFDNKKFPYPEDYSVWIFSFEDGVMKIVKSYTLPCD